MPNSSPSIVSVTATIHHLSSFASDVGEYHYPPTPKTESNNIGNSISASPIGIVRHQNALQQSARGSGVGRARHGGAPVEACAAEERQWESSTKV
jgi:hypothetical protein